MVKATDGEVVTRRWEMWRRATERSGSEGYRKKRERRRRPRKKKVRRQEDESKERKRRVRRRRRQRRTGRKMKVSGGDVGMAE
jgi:hypothetical protein